MSASKPNLLDLRPMLARGEEPFLHIRARVDALAANDSLTLIAPFLPAPLIELLKGEGFQLTVEHRGDGSWLVVIRRP